MRTPLSSWVFHTNFLHFPYNLERRWFEVMIFIVIYKKKFLTRCSGHPKRAKYVLEHNISAYVILESIQWEQPLDWRVFSPASINGMSSSSGLYSIQSKKKHCIFYTFSFWNLQLRHKKTVGWVDVTLESFQRERERATTRFTRVYSHFLSFHL